MGKKEESNTRKNEVFSTIDVTRYGLDPINKNFNQFYSSKTGLDYDRDRPHMKPHDIELER
jgi:hypothetical protein